MFSGAHRTNFMAGSHAVGVELGTTGGPLPDDNLAELAVDVGKECRGGRHPLCSLFAADPTRRYVEISDADRRWVQNTADSDGRPLELPA